MNRYTEADAVERFDPDDDAVVENLMVDEAYQSAMRPVEPKPIPNKGLEQVAQYLSQQMSRKTAIARKTPKKTSARGSRDAFGASMRRVDDLLEQFDPDDDLERMFRQVDATEVPQPNLEDQLKQVASVLARNIESRGKAKRGARNVALAAEPRGLLDVFDPRHNLREMAKEFLLLEDHLAQPAKHCPDCIRKHLLKAEALAEEAVQLDRDGSMRARLVPLPGQIRNIQRAFLADTDRNKLQQEVRVLRKQLAKESFDALSFKPSGGSTNRTPVIFATERGDQQAAREERAETVTHIPGPYARGGSLGRDDKKVSPSELPSFVKAALNRRLEAGLDGNPAPVLYRYTSKSGTRKIGEGDVVEKRGTELVIRTRGDKPRTLIVPKGDVVFDLSQDRAFTAIPWPASIPVTRKGGNVEDFVLDTKAENWRNVRAMAAIMWPVWDAWAVEKAKGSEDVRRGILQRLLIAAVINAVYESSLRADAEGDDKKAIGLFQLREDGAGVGMSKEQRKDPFANIARIAQRFLEVKKFFVPLADTEAAAPGSTTPAPWAGLFGRYVEAPTDRDGAERLRSATTAAGFPQGIAVALAPPPAPAVERKPEEFDPTPWIVGGSAGAVILVGGWLAAKRWRQ